MNTENTTSDQAIIPIPTKLNFTDLQEILITIFTKEMQTYEYFHEYTPERRRDIAAALHYFVNMIYEKQTSE